MTPADLAADLRTRINPQYATQLGTESYERRLCAEAIEGLLATVAERDAEIEQLTGVAFLACVERDELRMELGDLPEAQSDMLETIKAQRKALGQALEALQSLFGAPNQYYTNADAGGVAVWRLGGSDLPRRAITAIEEVLK